MAVYPRFVHGVAHHHFRSFDRAVLAESDAIRSPVHDETTDQT